MANGELNLIDHNKQILNENRKRFQNTFKISMTRFMHPLTGFDIFRFDDWLGTPKGVSIHDYLLEKYGKDAVALLESCIK